MKIKLKKYIESCIPLRLKRSLNDVAVKAFQTRIEAVQTRALVVLLPQPLLEITLESNLQRFEVLVGGQAWGQIWAWALELG